MSHAEVMLRMQEGTDKARADHAAGRPYDTTGLSGLGVVRYKFERRDLECQAAAHDQSKCCGEHRREAFQHKTTWGGGKLRCHSEGVLLELGPINEE